MSVLREEGLDSSGTAVKGQAAEIHSREVAGKADLDNSATVFESDEGTGDGAAKVVGLGIILLCRLHID